MTQCHPSDSLSLVTWWVSLRIQMFDYLTRTSDKQNQVLILRFSGDFHPDNRIHKDSAVSIRLIKPKIEIFRTRCRKLTEEFQSEKVR